MTRSRTWWCTHRTTVSATTASFCDGEEFCDVLADCQPGLDPCDGGTCDEDLNICEGDLIFTDGFESGDTSAWSVTVP